MSITIKSSPVINIAPQYKLIKVGDQLQLDGNIIGSISSFQWAPADKLENPNVLLPNTTRLTDNTTYTSTAVCYEGYTASKSVIIKISNAFYMPMLLHKWRLQK